VLRPPTHGSGRLLPTRRVDTSARTVVGDVSTNQAEGYFGQLKRSIDGTHHHVSKHHLHRCVSEFGFRYTTCNLSDSERMKRLMRQTGGRRLTRRMLAAR